MSLPPFSHLVVVETQRTKRYLFASPYMRETRGASFLLDRLNRQHTRTLLHTLGRPEHDFDVVYLGGGSGRVLFRSAELANEFRDGLLRLYRKETVAAQVAVAVVERRDGESFADWVYRGVALTQSRKLAGTKASPVFWGRWIMPCTSCGRAPAERMLTEHGEHRLCAACWFKREEIRETLYPDIKPNERGDHPLSSVEALRRRYSDEFVYTTLAEHCRSLGADLVFLPQDFDDIGDCSKPTNYMGFIYADGNRMGEIVKGLGSLSAHDGAVKHAYGVFSDITDRATREAAVEAVIEHVKLRKQRDEWTLPAEFILAGGDDLILAVPADAALPVACTFLDKFQEKTREFQCQRRYGLDKPFAPQGLTTSAGVVLAHVAYPASALMDLTADLMKMAKHKVASLDLPMGTIDFAVLTEATSESMKQRRNDEYVIEHSPRLLTERTERPYTACALKDLLASVAELKQSGVPRSKIKGLYPHLFESIWQAQYHGQRMKERLAFTGDLDRSPALKALTESTCFPFQPHRTHWRHQRLVWTTPLVDIIELYDFVHPPVSLPGTANA